MRKLEIVAAVALIAAVSSGAWRIHKASAHSNDYGFVWIQNSYSYTGVADSTAGGWSSEVSGGITSWWDNTPLFVHADSAGSIRFYSGSYGATGWYGGASVWSGSTLCVSPGNPTYQCNFINKKGDYAALALNDSYSADYQTYTWLKQQTATHELGHPFGLDHPPCSDYAAMNIAVCFGPSFATGHDSSDVDRLY